MKLARFARLRKNSTILKNIICKSSFEFQSLKTVVICKLQIILWIWNIICKLQITFQIWNTICKLQIVFAFSRDYLEDYYLEVAREARPKKNLNYLKVILSGNLFKNHYFEIILFVNNFENIISKTYYLEINSKTLSGNKLSVNKFQIYYL